MKYKKINLILIKDDLCLKLINTKMMTNSKNVQLFTFY